MQAFARYVMKEKKNAILMAFAMSAIPLLFFLSSSIVALVFLRKGIKESFFVFLASLIPASLWIIMGNPIPLFCLIGTLILAYGLRFYVSWVKALLLLIPFGILTAWLIVVFYESYFLQIFELSQKTNPELFSQIITKENGLSADSVKLIVSSILLKGCTFMLLVFILCASLLARSWQSALYNPGAFKEEIHNVRFSFVIAMVLFFGWFFSFFSRTLILQATSPVFSLPLLLASFSLIHGLIAIKRSTYSLSLLIIFYFLISVIYPLGVFLAFLDSIFHFRQYFRKQ